MVDSTDLIILTSVVQTVVITLTLAVFIFQFRSQEKSIREAAIQNVMGRYTDYVRMLVERPELAGLMATAETGFDPLGPTGDRLSPKIRSPTLTSCSGTASLRRCTPCIRKNGWTRRLGSSGRLS